MSTNIRSKFAVAALALLTCAAASTTPSYATPTPVLTQHNDNSRSGDNLTETILNPKNVITSKFGKLFSLTLDSSVMGQILYVPNMTINGAVHNVIYIATGTGSGDGTPCSVYAYDADNVSGVLLWRLVLAPNAQWMTAAPVIDPVAQIIYTITKANNSAGATQLHAINMLTGIEEPGSPVTIAGSVPGTGDGSVNGVVTFDSGQQNTRCALLLQNGIVYSAFSHGYDYPPFHGWVFGYQYNGTGFTQTGMFCDTPNGSDGGIWMGGAGLAADATGNIYMSTGNGTFDTNTGGIDYAMSVLKLGTPSLALEDYFTPEEEPQYTKTDQDVDCSGVMLIPGQNLLMTGVTKYGSSYILNENNLGGFAPSSNQTNIVQAVDGIPTSEGFGNNPVYFNAGTAQYVYLWPTTGGLKQYTFDPVAGLISPATPVHTYASTPYGSLAVSADGTSNGILWAVEAGGSILAFDATNVSKIIWSSNQNKNRDGNPTFTHFGVPTVTNGKLYVPTGSASVNVYGILKPPSTVLHDIADATIKAGTSANTNYGSTTTFALHRAQNNGTNASNRAAYLQFDLTNVTTAPTTATLTVHLTSTSTPSSGTATINLYGSTSPWTESSITWNNAPDFVGSTFTFTSTLISSLSEPIAAEPVAIDVTAFVAANLGHVVTFELNDPNVDGATLYGITKEGNASLQPSLTFTGGS